ncbi:Hypothetical predicted protein [Lynx pardinus]|uniref:Uncharacterized protein n=1 Tax=Lynx pardinus TaxID=191816 RepID=A0A485PD02_LYNPA|nr:Hypothetical predicted protein [Lynx pardinus]
MGRGRSRGRRSRSRSAGGGARGREQRREGRKEEKEAGRQGATVESVQEKRAPAALVLAPGGGGLERQEGGSLRWFSRCRALLAFLPARWASPRRLTRLRGPAPRPPRYVLIPSSGFHGAP